MIRLLGARSVLGQSKIALALKFIAEGAIVINWRWRCLTINNFSSDLPYLRNVPKRRKRQKKVSNLLIFTCHRLR